MASSRSAPRARNRPDRTRLSSAHQNWGSEESEERRLGGQQRGFLSSIQSMVQKPLPERSWTNESQNPRSAKSLFLVAGQDRKESRTQTKISFCSEDSSAERSVCRWPTCWVPQNVVSTWRSTSSGAGYSMIRERAGGSFVYVLSAGGSNSTLKPLLPSFSPRKTYASLRSPPLSTWDTPPSRVSMCPPLLSIPRAARGRPPSS